jgi:microcystin-dependent protein
MSAELTALEALANDNITAWFRLSALSQAVLFYATPYLTERANWLDKNDPTDEISDAEWDTLQAYVDQLLYEAKNPMIGYIIPFVTTDPPPNVLPCDGSSYLRVDYPTLYDLLDPFFITDADNFVVPDLRGRTIIGAGVSEVLTTRSVGDQGGEENHILTESELAAHVHTIPLTATTLAVEPGEVTVMTPVPFFTQNTGSTGGDEAHNNMQPFFAINYGIIAS